MKIVASLIIAMFTPLCATAGQGLEDFSNLEYDYVIHYPKSFSRSACPEDFNDPSCVALTAAKSSEPDIYIRVLEMDPVNSLQQDGLFEKEGEKWFKNGRFDRVEAITLIVGSLRGYQATAACGISTPKGIQNSGKCITIYLGDNNKTIMLESTGIVEPKVVKEIARTVEFF